MPFYSKPNDEKRNLKKQSSKKIFYLITNSHVQIPKRELQQGVLIQLPGVSVDRAELIDIKMRRKIANFISEQFFQVTRKT